MLYEISTRTVLEETSTWTEFDEISIFTVFDETSIFTEFGDALTFTELELPLPVDGRGEEEGEELLVEGSTGGMLYTT
jgi:hypothetical protein